MSVSRLSATAASIAEWTSVVSLLLMSVLVSSQVVLRYVLGRALPWAEEAAVYMMVWVAFVGAAGALQQSQHMALTFLVERLPAWVQRMVMIVSHLLVLSFLLLVLVLGLQLAVAISGQRSPALGLNMFWPYLVLPLGCLFMAAIMLDKIVGRAEVHERPTSEI
jgi:TRAP-type C4-dicarboxylate transport system permease small subunit